jgi:hypothetical protein
MSELRKWWYTYFEGWNGAVSDQAIGFKWEGVGGNTAPKKTQSEPSDMDYGKSTPGAKCRSDHTPTTPLILIRKLDRHYFTENKFWEEVRRRFCTKIDSQIQNPVLTLAFDIPHTVYAQKVNFEAEPGVRPQSWIRQYM